MDPSQQRVSDAERNATTDRLRVAAEEGRLDVDELDERVATALSARTRAELDGLTADLPAAAPPSLPPKEARAEHRQEILRPFIGVLTAGFICTLIWLATGARGSFWPIWVFLPAGILLITMAGRALGGGDDDDRRDLPPGPPRPPAPPRL